MRDYGAACIRIAELCSEARVQILIVGGGYYRDVGIERSCGLKSKPEWRYVPQPAW